MLPSKIFNHIISFSEMSYQYKVHEGFHLSHVAFVEEYCHCLPADDSELYLRPGPLFKNLIILKLSL
jgi:hypothetical protein